MTRPGFSRRTGSWRIHRTFRSDTWACAAIAGAASPTFRRIWISWRVMAPINPPVPWGRYPRERLAAEPFTPCEMFRDPPCQSFWDPHSRPTNITVSTL